MSTQVKALQTSTNTWTSIWNCIRCEQSGRYPYIKSAEGAIDMAELNLVLHEMQVHGTKA